MIALPGELTIELVHCYFSRTVQLISLVGR